MIKEDFYFLSNDGKTTLHGIKWIPEEKEVRGILQIIHGMTEYIDRYDEFATFMCSKGYLVVGHDHLGHGDSIQSVNDYGYFAAKHPGTVLIKDIHDVRLMVSSEYRDKKYFMLGHSMGSYLLRRYLSSRGNGLSGVVIVGTGYVNKAACNTGIAICKKLAQKHGGHYVSKKLEAVIFSGDYWRFDMTGKDLTRNFTTKDIDILLARKDDPKSGFTFTVNGFYTLISTVLFSERKSNIRRIPKDLPIFLIAGDQDPVGGMGKGVRKVYNIYQKMGLNVGIKMYEGFRHEVLNEINREEVYADVLSWIEGE